MSLAILGREDGSLPTLRVDKENCVISGLCMAVFVSTKFHFDETISLAGLVSLSSLLFVRSSCHIYGNFAMG